jgi:hypothetical protein
MKTKMTALLAITLLTLTMGSQSVMASESEPTAYKLLLSNGQTVEIVAIQKVVHKPKQAVSNIDFLNQFNLDSGLDN